MSTYGHFLVFVFDLLLEPHLGNAGLEEAFAAAFERCAGFAEFGLEFFFGLALSPLHHVFHLVLIEFLSDFFLDVLEPLRRDLFRGLGKEDFAVG